MQKTLAKECFFLGNGLHTGEKTWILVKPAEANRGIVFRRNDIDQDNEIANGYNKVVDTNLSTTIANESGVYVRTVEHLNAALWGCSIDNALIIVGGPEIPIMDGSSGIFISEFNKVGFIEQQAPVKRIIVSKKIGVYQGDKFIELMPPADNSQEIDINMSIDFPHHVIGSQSINFDEKIHKFTDDIAKARTFGFVDDIKLLQSKGLARGASLENAIGLDQTGVLNPEGLRYKNEFVRHKVLDCLGDLYLAGCRLGCKVKAHKSGHAMHVDVLHKMFADSSSYRLVD